jgi:hypothetical protein
LLDWGLVLAAANDEADPLAPRVALVEEAGGNGGSADVVEPAGLVLEVDTADGVLALLTKRLDETRRVHLILEEGHDVPFFLPYWGGALQQALTGQLVLGVPQ